MLISSTIPDIEIRKSKKPIALFLSAGRIKPLKIIPRANQFAISDHKTRGIYNINNRYLYKWGIATCYWYSVEESNVLDPILVDKINKYMEENSLITLTLKDVKQGIRLRQLAKQYDVTKSLEELKNEEKLLDKDLQDSLKNGLERIETATQTLKEQYEKDIPLSPSRKSYILLTHLKEVKILNDEQYANYISRVYNNDFDFDSLLSELQLLHSVSVFNPIDEETEKFILHLTRQHAEQWLNLTMDLRDNKGGIYEMLAKRISSFYSYLLMVPANFLISFFPSKIQIHHNEGIGIMIKKNRIEPYIIKTKNRFFVIDDRKRAGVYETQDKFKNMLDRIETSTFNVLESEVDRNLLKKLKKYNNRNVLYDTKKGKGKKGITTKTNDVLEYLITCEPKKISQDDYGTLYNKIYGGLDFDSFVEELEKLNLIKVNKPLNLDVNGFIKELGAQNAQNWAGFVQKLRSNKKDNKDLTKVPTKAWFNPMFLLVGGILVMIVIVLMMSHTGGGGSGGLDIFKMFSGKP